MTQQKPVPSVENGKGRKNQEEKVFYQIFTILIACIPGLTMGMLFSWTSPSIPKIVDDKVNYDISLDEASYFTVIPPIGAICSCLFVGKLNDLIGRKSTLLLIAVPQMVALILIATSSTVELFYISRFISGMADSIVFTTLPTYVAEISTPKVRGTWGNCMTFSIYLGQFMINLVGSYTSIEMAAYISIIGPIIFAITFPFMPESPYYYLMKGRIEEARVSLQKFRRTKYVEEELFTLKSDVERQLSETGTWKDLFTIKSNRKAVYAGIFLRASQQLGGIPAFVVYTQYIFQRSGGDVSASTSSLIFCGLCTILNLCASYALDKVGRRKSYIASCIACGIVLLGESVYFMLDSFSNVDVQIIRWFPLAGMITFVVFYSFGLGIVPTLMLGELFSASVKAKGLCLLQITFSLLVSSVTKLFHLLDTSFGLFAPFLFFSVSCFASSILAIYFVPETQGKTLEEIQQDLKSKKKKNNVNTVAQIK